MQMEEKNFEYSPGADQDESGCSLQEFEVLHVTLVSQKTLTDYITWKREKKRNVDGFAFRLILD